MKFMITKKNSGPVTNCSQTFKDQKEVNSVKKREEPQASRKLVRAASQNTQRAIPMNERKWEAVHAHSPDWGHLAAAVSKMVTKMLRHYDPNERQLDGSMHWDTIGPVLLRAFAQEGTRDSDEGFWFFLIHEGSNKKRLEYSKDNSGSLCHLRAVQGHSGGIPIRPDLMGYTRLFRTSGRSTSFTEEFRGIFNPFWGVTMTGLDKQSSLHLWIHSETTWMKKNLILITLFLKNNTVRHIWKRNQDAVKRIKLSRAQDQGLRFWQTIILLYSSARRLHWSSDFSEPRSNNVREALNTKVSTQGYVKV